MTKGTILVTGAEGFIGRHLCHELERQGHCIHRFSRRDDVTRFPLSCPNLAHVFHLAARTFVPHSWDTPWPFYQTNVLGTVNALELCRRHGAPLTLVSSYLYGAPHSLPVSETHPLDAFNPYGHSKLLAEQTAHFYAQHFNIQVAIIRPFNIYGPGQADRFLIPMLLQQALDPEKIEFRVADSRPKRDYLHVDDLIALLLACYKRGAQGVFNAGSGHSTSVSELVDLLNTLTPRPKPLVTENRQRPNEVLDVVADISKARRELAWHPRVPLGEGIARMLVGLQAERGGR